LHGAWTPPDWLALGGGLRGALGGKRLAGEPPSCWRSRCRPICTRASRSARSSLNVTVGGNGAARPGDGAMAITSYLVSREHFVAFRQEDAPWSVRAGRFFPTFGLRPHDHTAYVRRHLDMYLLEEPYAVEGEYTRGRWQAFASAFVGNPSAELAAGDRASGGAASVERLWDAGAVAGHARAAVGPEDRRYLVGAVGKRWFAGPGLLLLAELDVQRQRLATGFVRYQLVGYLGVTRPFLPGYLVGATVQRYAPDVSFRGTTRNAVELNLQAFPWAHTELHLLTRAEATGGATTHPNLLALLQLHYFL
jgi:hypothetical protein